MKLSSIIIIISLMQINYMFAEDSTYYIENLGPNVNSRWDERAPIISPDGKILYFTRGGHPENTGAFRNAIEQDIWYSILQDDGTWSKAENIGPPLNTIYPNSVCTVTPDGNTMIVLGAYNKNGEARSGYSISHRTTQGWSFPEKLNIKAYYTESRYSNLYMNNDGNVLIMALQRADSYGLKDLFVSFRENGNNWSAPINIGPVVNTYEEEDSPFLASDGKTLYFSSKGHEGLGGYDIFVTKRLDSTWTKWSEPVNIGKPINSVEDDLFFRIPSSGDYVYFLSYENSYGQGDIFRTVLPENIRPEPVALISGKILFAYSEEPLDAKIYYELMPDFKEVGSARTDPKTGEYKITLPLGAKYRFYASSEDFISSGGKIDLTGYEEYVELDRDIELSPIEIGQVLELKNIYFEYGDSELPEEYELSQVVLFLNGNPGAGVEIIGYYGNNEEEFAGSGLSLKRAQQAAEFIIFRFISKRRISFRGEEFDQSSRNEENKGRIEFKIITE